MQYSTSVNQIPGKKIVMGNAKDICLEGGLEGEIIRRWR
jgi:hypothetical protein